MRHKGVRRFGIGKGGSGMVLIAETPTQIMVPIITVLDMSTPEVVCNPSWNYRVVDWQQFNSTLSKKLKKIDLLYVIATMEDFQKAAKQLHETLRHIVTPVTVPTPVHPIPTCLHHSQVIKTITEHLSPIPNPLTPSQASLHLSNALPNSLTPLHLIDTFPTPIPIFDLTIHWSHEVQLHTSLTQCILVCFFLSSIYLFSLLSAVCFPMSHHSLLSAHFYLILSSPSLFTLVFIYLYSIPLSTLFSYPILSL